MAKDPVYFDCLSNDSIGSSCLKWSLKDYQADSYMFASTDTDKIKENVLSSPRVSSAIDKVIYVFVGLLWHKILFVMLFTTCYIVLPF